jgi:IS5 family transposase
MVEIQYAKGKRQRLSPYKDLLKVTEKTIGYAQRVVAALQKNSVLGIQGLALSHELTHFIGLSLRVCDQARRRVILGESVPANEKVVSIFEDHTDIIIKDRRDAHYGHKICLTGGASNLILDCVILEGNPSDTELVEEMLDPQNDIYGRYPLKAAFDDGFASKTTLASAKGKGLKDVCFAQKRGLHQADMCRSDYVYKKLRCFRAGIESGISWLKRSFGLTRCTWKGFRSFKCYVLASVVAANLLTMARKRLAIA